MEEKCKTKMYLSKRNRHFEIEWDGEILLKTNRNSSPTPHKKKKVAHLPRIPFSSKKLSFHSKNLFKDYLFSFSTQRCPGLLILIPSGQIH